MPPRFLPGRPIALLRRTAAALVRGGAGTASERARRQGAAADREQGMPRRLRQDLDRALALSDDAARRAAVDRVVRGIADGTYGTGFRRGAMGAADHNRPDDPV
ncbi:hypothetical protein DI272_09940 [Streptomyces sp. Act143]|nr:hypothetical protein DI272_09940 [Streptomyces sp. Act143]